MNNLEHRDLEGNCLARGSIKGIDYGSQGAGLPARQLVVTGPGSSGLDFRADWSPHSWNLSVLSLAVNAPEIDTPCPPENDILFQAEYDN